MIATAEAVSLGDNIIFDDNAKCTGGKGLIATSHIDILFWSLTLNAKSCYPSLSS